MNKKNFFSSILVLLALVLTSCVSTLTEYKATTLDEVAIKDVLISWHTSWNKQDKNAVLALFAEDARIGFGTEKRLRTKAEYTKELDERLAKNKRTQAGSTKIKVNGDEATAVVAMKFPTLGCGGDLHFGLRKESSRWLISYFEIKNYAKF